jgi:hypothetical protein
MGVGGDTGRRHGCTLAHVGSSSKWPRCHWKWREGAADEWAPPDFYFSMNFESA